MLFRRRESESWWERLRVHLWPRRSWSRSGRYVIYRLRRLSASPHAIALGFAAGAFAAATPYIGTHLMMGALVAWAVGGSVVASVLGTFIGNPLTYPILWFASYEVGNAVLGSESVNKNIDLSSGLFQSSFEQLWPILKPMSIGCVPVGLAVAAACYFLVRPMVDAYQHRRKRELRLRNRRHPVSASGATR
jgi:uncharacterized protein (DUF2062 family)